MEDMGICLHVLAASQHALFGARIAGASCSGWLPACMHERMDILRGPFACMGCWMREGLLRVQIFLEVSKLVGGLGYLIQGGYPAKATYIEQFLKPTPLEIATKEIARLQGKPKTLALGSDTMVRACSLLCPFSACACQVPGC